MAFLAGGVLWAAACRRPERVGPPPEARRPQLKTAAELEAERQARIASGEIVPTSAPAIATTPRRPARRQAPLLKPAPGAIEAELLIVNDAALTVPEVLYPLRRRLEELRQTRTPAGFQEEARRLIRRAAQEEIGSLLIYAEALGQLDEKEREVLDQAVEKELESLTTHDFGGSTARLDAYLRECGLSKEQLRGLIRRNLVVRQYTREKLMPQVYVSRQELLEYYRQQQTRFSTPEARELSMIELPFAKFLPAGKSWESAGRAAQAQARLKAMRRAREAYAALQQRPFEDVAREFSLGAQAERGGSWGLIGRPLQPPYDTVSRLIFDYEEGQVSEPIETDTGWYIVRCNRIQPARQRSFTEVQGELRDELMERRFAKLSTDYVLRLAENATIASFETFVAAAVRRATESGAPGGR